MCDCASRIRGVSDPLIVAGRFMRCEYLDRFPWSYFPDDDEPGEEATEDAEPLDVFVTELRPSH